jgi:hypothetical protein
MRLLLLFASIVHHSPQLDKDIEQGGFMSVAAAVLFSWGLHAFFRHCAAQRKRAQYSGFCSTNK